MPDYTTPTLREEN